jgi:hypothetical protein
LPPVSDRGPGSSRPDVPRGGAGTPPRATSRQEARWAQEFKKGDRVPWEAGNQSSVGTVEEKITSETEASGRKVEASKEEPQYLVPSEKSGNTAVHHPDKIHRA